MDNLKEKIREFVCNSLKERANRVNISICEIEDDCNLLESGLLDSMGFVDLMVSVEGHFDVEFHFEELDPSEFTTLSGFLNCVVKNR